jgi:hypothetical protein
MSLGPGYCQVELQKKQELEKESDPVTAHFLAGELLFNKNR